MHKSKTSIDDMIEKGLLENYLRATKIKKINASDYGLDELKNT